MYRMFALVGLLAGGLALPVDAVADPRLSAPHDLTAPEVEGIRLDGLEPGAHILIETRQLGEDGTDLVSRAEFTASLAGRIDTASDAPITGSYSGVEAEGLFWSAVPAAVASTISAPPEPHTVSVVVTQDDRVVARTTVPKGPDLSGVIVSRDTPFPGAVWARPATPGRHPVVIVLGGSEGGSSTAVSIAPMFAARGYATLGLPYYDPGYDQNDRLEGLPSSFTEIPVDRLEAVRSWLATQDAADLERIGIWGASKGAEFALIAASRFDWIDAVAAIVPSDLVWEGWGNQGTPTSSFSIDGMPMAFEPYSGMAEELAKASRGQAMDLRRVHVTGRIDHPDRIAAARIPAERFKGSLLLAGGGEDTVWPSAEMATAIAANRDLQGLTTRLLVFPNAGHLLGGPGTVPSAQLAGFGGNAVAIAHARMETWRQTFIMFTQALRP